MVGVLNKLKLVVVINNSCSSTRPFAHGKEGLYPWGNVFCVTFIPTVKLPTGNHYAYTKKNKRITNDIPRKVVGFIYGLSNHKSGLTKRVEGNGKYGHITTRLCSE